MLKPEDSNENGEVEMGERYLYGNAGRLVFSYLGSEFCSSYHSDAISNQLNNTLLLKMPFTWRIMYVLMTQAIWNAKQESIENKSIDGGKNYTASIFKQVSPNLVY